MFHRKLEMTIARDEFLRLLGAVGAFEFEGDTARSSAGDPRWAIRLVRLADHAIGAAVLPRHLVEIEVDAGSEADEAAFVDRFRRAFLRGGG